MSLSFWQMTEGHPTGKQRRERGSFTEVVEKVLGSISFSQASTSPFDYAAEDSESTLAGLTSEKCVSINIKEPGLLFTLASPKVSYGCWFSLPLAGRLDQRPTLCS
jgi:hypothetical protein